MEPLQNPDLMFLNAAQGWLELGNLSESSAELDHLSLAAREHPDVLELRWQIAVKSERWSEALAVAEALCRLVPESPFGWIHRSYCLHELHRTREAWDTLLPVADRFSKDWLLCYNLACYACQLGWLEESKAWLSRALALGNPSEINRLAAKDKDLLPLFQQLP